MFYTSKTFFYFFPMHKCTVIKIKFYFENKNSPNIELHYHLIMKQWIKYVQITQA